MADMMCYCGVQVNCGCIPKPSAFNFRKETQRVDILLLGPAESGKSTMMRQIKIIHDGEMKENALRPFRNHVIRNVNSCVQLLLNAVFSSGLIWSTNEAIEAAMNLKNSLASEDSRNSLTDDDARFISIVWNDETSQNCWSRANEFSLPDSTAYYLSAVDRIAQTYFVPTQEDVLRLRLPTTAATVHEFQDKKWTFRITDVGGQKGQRKKWIQLFHGVQAIIFLAALSEYDQYWREDEEEGGINRLRLALNTFTDILFYTGFRDSSFILFLNKVDVFQQKIRTSHLDQYFPGYQGMRSDYKQAYQYIKEMFTNSSDRASRLIYTHETCATDTDRTKVIFAAVRDSILWRRLRGFFDPD